MDSTRSRQASGDLVRASRCCAGTGFVGMTDPARS
ncbi:MAG: hypothetical protein K0S98_863, partial [Propionibacteriaceae bacterium]|nr:hypothetical protein [Propionibacteriaceae bacterium]